MWYVLPIYIEVCINYTSGMYLMYIWYVLNLHVVCSLCACGMYLMYMWFVLVCHVVITDCTCGVFTHCTCVFQGSGLYLHRDDCGLGHISWHEGRTRSVGSHLEGE